MDRKWSEKTTVENTAEIISAIALVIWLVFEAIGRTKNVQYAELIGTIALIVVCICEAVAFWNVKRALSYVAIGGTVLIIAVAILAAMLIA